MSLLTKYLKREGSLFLWSPSPLQTIRARLTFHPALTINDIYKLILNNIVYKNQHYTRNIFKIISVFATLWEINKNQFLRMLALCIVNVHRIYIKCDLTKIEDR